MNGDRFPRAAAGERTRLRLVPPPPPRRYETRIVVSSARMPIGRTRPFRLSDSDLERLIALAERLGARA